MLFLATAHAAREDLTAELDEHKDLMVSAGFPSVMKPAQDDQPIEQPELAGYVEDMDEAADDSLEALGEDDEDEADSKPSADADADPMPFPAQVDQLSKEQIADFEEAFKKLDPDGNGFISAEEVRDAMKQSGEELSDEYVDEIFREVDIDEDGQINFEDFVKTMMAK